MGPSEVAVIVVVGWLLLGPDKMVKLAKDTGKLLGQVRRTADEARDSLKDAIDLDMVAAEANAIQNEFEAAAAGITEPRKSTRKAEKLGSDDDGLGGVDESEDSLMEEMGVSANGQETKSGPSQDAGIEAEAGGSAGFLDQLRRVSDPNQVSPGEVPDLSVDAEESEVERLELEYLAAKEKLESRRRAKANAEERDDAESETR